MGQAEGSARVGQAEGSALWCQVYTQAVVRLIIVSVAPEPWRLVLMRQVCCMHAMFAGTLVTLRVVVASTTL